MSKKHNKKWKNNPSRKNRAAQKELSATSTDEMINAINYMLSVLHGRGVVIRNWDNKDKELGIVRMYKCKPYYTEGNIEPEEVHSDEYNSSSNDGDN